MFAEMNGPRIAQIKASCRVVPILAFLCSAFEFLVDCILPRRIIGAIITTHCPWAFSSLSCCFFLSRYLLHLSRFSSLSWFFFLSRYLLHVSRLLSALFLFFLFLEMCVELYVSHTLHTCQEKSDHSVARKKLMTVEC